MLDLVRDGRFVAAAVSLLLLLAVCLWAGAVGYAETRARQDETFQDEWDRWLSQGDRNPHSAAHQGFWMFQPLDALSLLDPGIRNHAGAGVHLEAHSQRLFRYRPAEDSTWVQRAGELTAALTLQRFVPLLIILLGFAVLAGEREQGVLRLALSTGAPPRALVLGKALGLAAPLAVVLAPASLLGGLALALYGEASTEALWARTLLLAGCYLAYFAVFVAITLAVSARAAKASQALTLLLFFWIASVLLAPPLVLSAAAERHPTPTAFAFAGDLQRARAEGPLYFERLILVEDRLLAEYGVTSIDQLPMNSEGVAMLEEEAEEGAIQDAHFRRLYAAYRAQDRMFQWGSAVSPLVAVQTLSMGLSGTSLDHHLHFADAAEQYRRVFVQMMNQDQMQNDDLLYLRGGDFWAETPRFVYTPPGLGEMMAGKRTAMAGLTFWLLVAVGGSAWAFRRFERERS